MIDAEFKIFVRNTLRVDFPENQGWKIHEHPMLNSGARPDFVVYGPDTFVIAVEDKAVLESRDIVQLLNYSTEVKARIGIIYIANDTEVPERVALHAKAKGVEIRRTQWWHDD